MLYIPPRHLLRQQQFSVYIRASTQTAPATDTITPLPPTSNGICTDTSWQVGSVDIARRRQLP